MRVENAGLTATTGVQPFTRMVGNTEVSIVEGDMTSLKVDALVVPEFKGSASWGGVGAAVDRAGGGSGLEAYEAKAETGTLHFGEVVATPSGSARWPTLIHAVTVGSGAEAEFSVVSNAIYETVKYAAANDIRSIAVPTLGTGIIGRLTDEQSAQAMLGAIARASADGLAIPEVTIAIFRNPAQYAAFTQVLEAGPSASTKAQVGEGYSDFSQVLDAMSRDARFVGEAAFEKPPPKGLETPSPLELAKRALSNFW